MIIHYRLQSLHSLRQNPHFHSCLTHPRPDLAIALLLFPCFVKISELQFPGNLVASVTL